MSLSHRVLSFGFFLSTTFLILVEQGDVPPWTSGLLLLSFLNLACPFSD
jgi:hypothetical protein